MPNYWAALSDRIALGKLLAAAAESFPSQYSTNPISFNHTLQLRCASEQRSERTGISRGFRFVLRDRELKRRVRVWERRCREEYTPLLEEWVPPTEKQLQMARSLGRVTAWEEILTVQKARWGQVRHVRLEDPCT